MAKRVLSVQDFRSFGSIGLAMLAFGVVAASPIGAAPAGEADVAAATISGRGDGTYGFSVTVRHADDGWEHFADQWEVLAPDGSVLGTRVLLHPHVDEQPFTRSLSGVAIPEDVGEVRLRARDSVHGYGGTEVTLVVPR